MTIMLEMMVVMAKQRLTADNKEQDDGGSLLGYNGKNQFWGQK